jgi:alpha-L-rhamnosidase
MRFCIRSRVFLSGALFCVNLLLTDTHAQAFPLEPITVENLRCEYLTNPLGIETSIPRLSWMLQGTGFGTRQSAYQVQMAASAATLEEGGAFWDSGKVVSDQSIQVSYGGRPLVSREQVFWRVRAWDGDDVPSPWSETAWFEMGLLSPVDWVAEWIEEPSTEDRSGAAPLFRREFHVEGQVARARAYVCGLGYHEFYLNGEKVGENVLDPAQTDYRKRALYVVHDITHLLREGDNAAGLWVGDGWFNQTKMYGHQAYGTPCAIAQIEITLGDGTVQMVGTDAQWRAGHGPVLDNNVHLGETYDARLELPGWASPGFDDTAWPPAATRNSPTESLQAQMMPGIRRIEEIRPVAITEPEAGVHIVDMGQNFAGWAMLRVRGDEGQRIHLRFAEVLAPDGSLDPRSTAIPQADTYICRGDGLETWEPRFTYHGFRYVELTGLSEPPDLDTLTGVVVHSAVRPIGTFTCSDPMLNRIHETALWTQRSNLHGVPTDNPHRERCGWLGDAHVVAEMTLFNFDTPLFWAKYVRDIETSLIGGVAPTYVAPGQGNPGPASADWASALIQLPWYVYLFHGDKSLIAEHYDSCARWLEEVRSNLLDEDLIHRQVGWNKGLGDWIPPGGKDKIDTPVPLTSTAYVYFDHVLMERMARALDKPEDARFYADFAARQQHGFNAAFYDPQNHTYGSQTANALALYLGLVPGGDKEKVAQRLAHYVSEKAGGHLTTGILGTRYLFGQLSRFGHGDVAVGILQKEDYPSIGHLFNLGATTLWEHWGEQSEPGVLMPEDGRNQAMRGSFDAWFFDGLCGIQPDPAQPGFKHFFVRPSFAGNLSHASVEYESPHGTIRSSWRRDAAGASCNVTVPANTTATIVPPECAFDTLLVNGRKPGESEGVIETRPADGALRVGAGHYELTFGLARERE